MRIKYKVVVGIVFAFIQYKTTKQTSCDNRYIHQNYASAFELSQNASFTQNVQQILSRCRFGSLHRGLDLNLCSDHCSLRSNCMAMYMEESLSCRFCLTQESELANFSISLNQTYVNMLNVNGKIFCNFIRKGNTFNCLYNYF